jgi:hypothetical protein
METSKRVSRYFLSITTFFFAFVALQVLVVGLISFAGEITLSLEHHLDNSMFAMSRPGEVFRASGGMFEIRRCTKNAFQGANTDTASN